MSDHHTAPATIESIEWEGVQGTTYDMSLTTFHPVKLVIELAADDLTGFDLTRPITITQEED